MMMSRKARGLEMMSRSFEAGIDTKSLANLLKLARIQELFITLADGAFTSRPFSY
jgi:lambda repressor-like predicted transcriptional regulator